MTHLPLPTTRPSHVSRATWWRAQQRGYLIDDYHRTRFRTEHADDLRLWTLCIAAMRRAPRKVGPMALARKLGVSRNRMRLWLEGSTMPPAEMLPAIRDHLMTVLAAAGVRDGHPTGTGQYTRRAACGPISFEEE